MLPVPLRMVDGFVCVLKARIPLAATKEALSLRDKLP
jgi:hypothetical protein